MIVPAGLALNNFITVAIIVAALYFTREIAVPITLALLLSFVLAPPVRLLQRLHLPRPLAVVATVAAALAVAVCLTTMVMVQVNQLAGDLPRYQLTLSDKIHSLRDVLGSTSVLRDTSSMLKDLGKELETGKKPDKSDKPATLARSGDAAKPIPVEVHQPLPGETETLMAVVQPLINPFITAGIVLIFVTFFLLRRQDLRNRFIKLVGSGDIERTTAALDDAGQRLGKVLATQLVLNATFGVIIGLGLALIGVPSAPLWGLLAMVLRFVPYIGAILAAMLPVTLAAAVGSDWTMAIWTAALFVVVETVMGQLIEPFIYGRSAGLSPVAIVLSAAFWAWLWGPLGLLLSTPLTLCVAVIARHVDRLQFLDIILGDQPALTPQQAAYQRMLTGDPVEAIDQARAFLKKESVVAYYDQILIGALRLAQADAERGRLDDARLENIFKTVSDVIEDLTEHGAGKEAPAKEGRRSPKGKIVPLADNDLGKPVFCVPGLGRLDECAVLVVAEIFKREGINAHVAGAATAMEHDETGSICLCYLENVSKSRIDYAVRKLSRQVRKARVVVCLLSDEERMASAPQQGKEPSHSLQAAIAAFAGREEGAEAAAGEPRAVPAS